MLRPTSLALSSLLLCALAISGAGCEGCLGLDQYQVVPTGGNAGSGGSGASGASGGAGGSPICGSPSLLMVSAAQEASLPDDAGDACQLAEPVGAGIEVRAFDSVSQDCVARARIVAEAGFAFESRPRIRSTTGDVALVAATFRQGGLVFPPACGATDPVLVEPGGAPADDTLVVAALRREAATFCTVWTRRAWRDGAIGALQLNAIDLDPAGRAAIGGSVSQPLLFDDGEGGTKVVPRGAFFAHYSQAGALDELVVLQGQQMTDAVLDVVPGDGQWLLTGTVQREQPACQGCSGAVHVLEPTNAPCPGSQGGGGTGGTGGTGGSPGPGGSGSGGSPGSGGSSGGSGPSGAGGAGGAAGSGGSGSGGNPVGAGGAGGGMPVVDPRNAFLWSRPTFSTTCSPFVTFGSDRLGLDDVQVGFGVSRGPSGQGCSLFFSGLAGRDAWRFAADGATALFNAGGATLDGFVARSDGAGPLCDGSPGPIWNVRLTPPGAGAVAVAERVLGEACNPFGSSVATTFVRGAVGASLSMVRCSTTKGCDQAASLLPLAASADARLVVMELDGSGEPSWSASLGPVRAPGDVATGTFEERSHHDIARDGFDRLYLVVTTDGPLALSNLDTGFDCVGLVEGLSAGTYVLTLRRSSSGTARCEWAYSLGP